MTVALHITSPMLRQELCDSDPQITDRLVTISPVICCSESGDSKLLHLLETSSSCERSSSLSVCSRVFLCRNLTGGSGEHGNPEPSRARTRLEGESGKDTAVCSGARRPEATPTCRRRRGRRRSAASLRPDPNRLQSPGTAAARRTPGCWWSL